MPKEPRKTLRKDPLPGDVITSIHKTVAGEPYAFDNSKDSLLYPGKTYDDFFGGFSPDQVIWYFYDNYSESPSEPDYVPIIGGITIPDFNKMVANGEDPGVQMETHKVGIKTNYKFNHGIKHDVIAVEYLDKKYKVKMGGSNIYQNGVYKNGVTINRPYFYVEIYNTELGQLEKCYGEFVDKPEGYSFGKRSYKKSKHSSKKRGNSDIKYLRSLL